MRFYPKYNITQIKQIMKQRPITILKCNIKGDFEGSIAFRSTPQNEKDPIIKSYFNDVMPYYVILGSKTSSKFWRLLLKTMVKYYNEVSFFDAKFLSRERKMIRYVLRQEKKIFEYVELHFASYRNECTLHQISRTISTKKMELLVENISESNTESLMRVLEKVCLNPAIKRVNITAKDLDHHIIASLPNVVHQKIKNFILILDEDDIKLRRKEIDNQISNLLQPGQVQKYVPKGQSFVPTPIYRNVQGARQKLNVKAITLS